MLIAASCPSNKDAAVTTRTGEAEAAESALILCTFPIELGLTGRHPLAEGLGVCLEVFHVCTSR